MTWHVSLDVKVCVSVLSPHFCLWFHHLLPQTPRSSAPQTSSTGLWASVSDSRTSPVFLHSDIVFPSDHLFQHRPSRWLLDIFSHFLLCFLSLLLHTIFCHLRVIQHRRRRIRLATTRFKSSVLLNLILFQYWTHKSTSLLFIGKVLFHCRSFCFSCHCQQVAVKEILGL